MKHSELLEKIYWLWRHKDKDYFGLSNYRKALMAVVELHSDNDGQCFVCADLNYSKDGFNDQDTSYPCSTIQAIEKELG